MNKITFFPHIISLSAVFVLGGGVLNLPHRGSDEFAFTAYLLSVGILIIGYFGISFLWDKINVTSYSNALMKTVYSVMLLGLGVFSLFCGAQSFTEITGFVSRIILPQTPKFLISLIFLLTVIYFSLAEKESLLKFSLVSIALVTGVILFFFIAQTDKYELRNIYIFRLPEIGEILSQMKQFIFAPMLSCIILPVYLKSEFGECRTKQGIWGAVAGCILLGLCFLSPILLFGAGVSGNLEFPFSSAVSTVTVGRLFTRLDGFAYFVYFVCSLIRITLCVRVALSGLTKIRKLVDKN